MARRTTAPSFTMRLDTTRFDAILDDYELRAEEAIRPAAQAAAQVFYDEVKKNVAQIRTVTGNLNKAIYQAYSPELSVDGQKATYRISWNWNKAPHGGLVEGGHLQRYKYYQDKQGRVRPMIRPGMEGKKKPAKNGPQSAKDAYYVTLPTPIQIPGKFFLRRAYDKQNLAESAAITKFLAVLSGANPVFGTEE